MILTDELFQKYITLNTTALDAPRCNDCQGYAELYDTLLGHDLCKSCLRKSLEEDDDTLKELIEQ